ncbi:MAG TPA: hypothetical protein VGF97_07150 [Rhizomicrobium sp.]|jgi:hypothetical protein
MHNLVLYLVALVVALIVLRRVMKSRKPRTVRLWGLWVWPAILLLVTLSSLHHEAFPGLLALLMFVIALGLGGLIGWYRVHTLEFSRDAQSGIITSQGSHGDVYFVVGLIALRYGLEYVLKNLSAVAGPDLVRASDTMLLFTTALFVARSVHTYVRARALLSSPVAVPTPSGAAMPAIALAQPVAAPLQPADATQNSIHLTEPPQS